VGLIRTLHAWAGAILALVLIVEGLSGALLVLKPDYLRLTMPQARIHVAATPQVLGAAADALEKAHPGHLRRVLFAGPELGIHQLLFMDQSYGYAAPDGRLLATWKGAERPETFVYELHHFLLSGDTGMKVVGYSALAACVLALLGVIVWSPLWRATRLRVWPASVKRRDMIAAHRNLGALFALPVILFCLTGGGIVFYKTTQSLLMKWLPGPVPEEFFPPADPGDIDWPKALAGAQAQFPDARIVGAVWPEGIWAPAIVKLRQPGELPIDGETEVLIDPVTSLVQGVKDSKPLGKGLRLYNDLWPIHTAAIGGRLYDLFALLSGLALAGLGVIGLWSFLVKQLRRS
jgi:uncharacterized iron-regulated membrane protein